MNNALAAQQIKTAIDRVPFIDLSRQYLLHKAEILTVIDHILSSGSYILGETVAAFEKRIADYLGCQFVLGVANATDAITLILKSLKIGQGDEVIVPVNSFIATAGSVVAAFAKPVFCDVTDDLNIDINKIESLITKKTKAIIPVHLTGRPAAMDEIKALAEDYSLAVIEDAAQAIGAKYKGIAVGAIGDIACFSLHPLKNLHVYGDGGLITTNNEELYNEIKLLRNHGLVNRDTCLKWGLNSRLDALQAGIAYLGVDYIDEWNNQRRQTASLYRQYLQQMVRVPQDKPHEYAVYHNFVIQTDARDDLMHFLASKGIESKIHYPIPIHLQPAAQSLGYSKGDFPVAERLMQEMLSLPIYSELTASEANYVIENMLAFYQGKA